MISSVKVLRKFHHQYVPRQILAAQILFLRMYAMFELLVLLGTIKLREWEKVVPILVNLLISIGLLALYL
jgi:hypothetical protein